MKLYARMLLQEVSKQLCLWAEVVEDHMNLLPGRPQRDHFFEGEQRSHRWYGGSWFF